MSSFHQFAEKVIDFVLHNHVSGKHGIGNNTTNGSQICNIAKELPGMVRNVCSGIRLYVVEVRYNHTIFIYLRLYFAHSV